VNTFAELCIVLNNMAAHIAVLNDDYTTLSATYHQMNTDIITLSQNVEWLMRTYWIIVGVLVGNFSFNLYHYRETKKNGKKS